MIFKRNIMQNLLEWKASPYRKPLILRGARQVGKTTLIQEFGKNYDSFYALNLELNEDRSYFTHNLSPQEILQKISLDTGRAMQGTTLLFLDEIQNSPEAIALLRYFYETMPEIHVIAAGSLLEIIMDVQDISFPVGRIEYLYLYPLSFTEFLQAIENTHALEVLKTVPLPDWAASSIQELFKTYTLIGGMPEAVDRYIQTKDIMQVNNVYRNLYTSFTDDVAKYASNPNQAHILRFAIESCALEIGNRIRFENFARSNYKSKEIGEALRILQRAMLLFIRYPSTSLNLPIVSDFKRSPRLQFLDTGLLNYKLGLQSDYIGSENLDAVYKGIFAEHIVCQELLALDNTTIGLPLFWVRESTNSNAELDFLLAHKNHLIPIEVKSGTTGTLKSLHSFIDRSKTSVAFRLYSGPLLVEKTHTPQDTPYTLIHLPLFLTHALFDYFELYTKK